MVGKKVYGFIPAEFHKVIRKAVEQVFGTGEPTFYEIEGLGAGGKTAWYTTRVGPVVRGGEVVSVTLISSDITDRRRSEEALRQSEARLRAFLNATPDMMFRVSRAGVFLDWKGARDVLPALPPEHFLGKKIEEVLPPEVAAAALSALEQAIRDDTVRLLEYQLPSGDEVREFEARFSAIGNDEAMIIVRDITDAKRARGTLRQSEEQYRDLVENIEEWICIHDLEGRLLSVNQAVVEQTEHERAEDLIGRKLVELMDPEVRHEFPDYLRTVIREGRAQGLMKIRTRTGKKKIVEYCNTLRREEDGRSFIRGVARDVTERLRIQATMERMRVRNELILNAAGEGIYGLDLEGRTTFVNPAAARMIGWDREELIGKSQHAVLHHSKPDGSPYPREDCPIYAAFMDGKTHRVDDEVFWRKDGTSFPVEYISTPIRDSEGEPAGAVVTFRDITERKRAAEALAERNAELAAANRELQAFTYSVSHDLRAPLRHINGFAEVLREDLSSNLDTVARRHLDYLLTGTKRMGALVDDLLRLSHIGRKELTRQPTNLSAMVESVRREMEMEIAGREVEWRVEELPWMDCDAGLVRQVFFNLLSNALKFTRTRDRAMIRVGWRKNQENGEDEIFVCDNGVGFSPKYAEKVFGVFQRLHPAEDFEGTGIGLAVVRRIVCKHGGRIRTETELDRGAAFYFTLGAAAVNIVTKEAATREKELQL